MLYEGLDITSMKQLVGELHAEDMASLEWRLYCEAEMDRYDERREDA